jgi:hypothetical protein
MGELQTVQVFAIVLDLPVIIPSEAYIQAADQKFQTLKPGEPCFANEFLHRHPDDADFQAPSPSPCRNMTAAAS